MAPPRRGLLDPSTVASSEAWWEEGGGRVSDLLEAAPSSTIADAFSLSLSLDFGEEEMKEKGGSQISMDFLGVSVLNL